MTYMSDMDLPPSPPILYDDQTDSHDTSLDSIDDNFDFDLNVDENHFSVSTNVPVPTILVVKLNFFLLFELCRTLPIRNLMRIG